MDIPYEEENKISTLKWYYIRVQWYKLSFWYQKLISKKSNFGISDHIYTKPFYTRMWLIKEYIPKNFHVHWVCLFIWICLYALHIAYFYQKTPYFSAAKYALFTSRTVKFFSTKIKFQQICLYLEKTVWYSYVVDIRVSLTKFLYSLSLSVHLWIIVYVPHSKILPKIIFCLGMFTWYLIYIA